MDLNIDRLILMKTDQQLINIMHDSQNYGSIDALFSYRFYPKYYSIIDRSFTNLFDRLAVVPHLVTPLTVTNTSTVLMVFQLASPVLLAAASAPEFVAACHVM